MPGAVIAGLLAFCIFVAVLLNPDYRLAVYAMVVIYVLATISSRFTDVSTWCFLRKKSSPLPAERSHIRLTDFL